MPARPGASGYTNLANNAAELQELRHWIGIYVAVGAAERLYNDIDGYDYLAQTLFGIKSAFRSSRTGFAKHNLERKWRSRTTMPQSTNA